MNNIYKLPDSYKKHSESNNSKLLSLNEDAVSDYRKAIENIYAASGIDTAKGTQLDMLGKKLDCQRGSLSDSKYKIILKAKINCDMCDGTFNGVLRCIGAIFADGVTSGIVMEESKKLLNIKTLPLSAIAESGMTGKQAFDLIKSLLPVGINLTADLEGTFSFASSNKENIETDTSAGFSDTNGETGGYFGMIIADSAAVKLPI